MGYETLQMSFINELLPIVTGIHDLVKYPS